MAKKKPFGGKKAVPFKKGGGKKSGTMKTKVPKAPKGKRK
jgi:hypothetical protein